MDHFALKSRVASVLLALFLLAIAGMSTPVRASESPAAPDGPVVVRVYYGARENLDTLAKTLDIWEVDHEQAYLLALVSPDRYLQLFQAGYRLEIDAVRTAELNQPHEPLPGQGVDSIPGYPCYRTVEETYAAMDTLATNNSSLASWIDIGDSWDKLTAGGPVGYDIFALDLTNQLTPGPKPTFFLMAEIHAREYVTAETAARFAEYLVSNYGVDPDITWLLDYYHVYIVPMTNPDGRKFAEAGDLWRKNTDSDDGCTDPDSWGTDLNRNHSFKWGGDSTNPCDETYQGPSAASEPETQVIQNFVLGLFPDQRGPGDTDPAPADTTGVFITLHSYSQLVLWPWGWTYTDAPNHVQLQTLGRKMAYFNGYTPQQSTELYPTTGTSDDWAYGTMGVAAYTFEMGTSFFQGCSTFENTIYPNNRNALMYAFKAARHPYMDPLGPESLSVTATPANVQPGTPVTLEAIANDTRYRATNPAEPTQNIAAARYTIDNPSWITGTVVYTMTVDDGSFNEKIEDVSATVDTSGLAPGKHTLFVESKDADNNWGVPGAVFLTVAGKPPIVAPLAAAQSGDPGQEIVYNLSVTNTNPLSDTFALTVDSAWVVDAPATLGPLGPGGNTGLAVTVTIPVAAVPGAVDVASLQIASQITGTPPVTVTLTTAVKAVYGLEVTADAEFQDGFPGIPVTYTLHITNTGNAADTFDVQALSQWEVSTVASTGSLASGESTTLTVVVSVPVLAPSGTSDTTTVTVTSQGDPDLWQAAVLTTTARWNGVWIPIVEK